jgi:hypothetical protein
VSATDQRARQADALQYELESGPCVDAILRAPVYAPTDLGHDRRWPEFGVRAHRELGWSSMSSFRLATELIDHEMLAGLNIYADHTDAFNQNTAQIGLLVATHAALAIATDTNAERATQLEGALRSNREIGVAMGVLMARHQLTRAQAFDLLRVASQHTNRKLADIAVEVTDAGTLDLPATAHHRTPHPPT